MTDESSERFVESPRSTRRTSSHLDTKAERSIVSPGHNSVSRVAAALNHPVRVRIIAALSGRSASASDLTEALADPLLDLNNVAYHVRFLRDTCDALEPVGTRQVRGAHQSFYRLKPASEFAAAWPRIPAHMRGAFTAAGLRLLLDALLRAIDARTFDREDATLVAMPMTLDHQGVAEVDAAAKEAVSRIRAAETASRRRIARGEGEELGLIFGLTAFIAPRVKWVRDGLK